MPSHRPGEITYYEELGVAQDATPEQIRDSFRALVRLLHPDHQTDALLREVAERQMRKINRIYAVLSDPEGRRSYDDTLEEAPAGPTIIFNPASNVNVRRLMARFAWVGAALITVVVLAWLASDSAAVPQFPAIDRTPPATRAATPASIEEGPNEVSQLRSQLRAMTVERDSALRELTRARGSSPGTRASGDGAVKAEVAPVPSDPSATLTELPSQVKPVAVATPPPPHFPPLKLPAAPRRSVAGSWFYIHPPAGQHNRNSALYPPEFIEATIAEQSGGLRGKYRSRYRIVDRAISPDVTFDFTCPTEGTTPVCPWTGPGGAKGSLNLKLTGDNSMEIEWTTNDLGTVQGLVSGTAKLTRRIE